MTEEKNIKDMSLGSMTLLKNTIASDEANTHQSVNFRGSLRENLLQQKAPINQK
jgi:hypothetical protein